MKVYIVTSGEYSDYSIEAVFSTEEKAETYKEALDRTGTRNTDVNEWEVDEIAEWYIATLVTMGKEGGVKYIGKSVNGLIGFKEFSYLMKYLSWGVKTEDEERAVKVTNEKRIQIMANNLWGNDDAVREMFSKKEIAE